MAHLGTWFKKHDGLWLDGQSGGSGQVNANIVKLRLYDTLTPVGTALGRRAVEKLRPRPGSWIWSDNGDNVEKLRVLTVSVPVPLFLAAEAEGTFSIRVSWTEAFADFDGVELWREVDGVEVLRTTVAPETKTFLDTGLDATKVYTYRARYNKLGVTGIWSNTASAQPYAFEGTVNLSATAISSSQINLAWSDEADAETGWEVQRKLPTDAEFVTVGTAAANAVAYSDTAVPAPETTYEYRVRAVGSGSFGPWSNVVQVASLAVFIVLLDSDLTKYGRSNVAPSGGVYTTLLDSTSGNGDDNSYLFVSQKHRCDEDIAGQVELRITNPLGADHGFRFWMGLFTSDGAGPLDGSGGGNPLGYGPQAGFLFEASQPATPCRVKGFALNPTINTAWANLLTLVDGNWHSLRFKYEQANAAFRLWYDGGEVAVNFGRDFLTTLRAYKTTAPAMFRTNVLLFGGATYIFGSATRSNVELRNPSYNGTLTPPPPNTWP